MERFLGPDVDLDPQQFLEILNQPGVVHKTPDRSPCNKQIEVAVLVGLTSGHGTEYAEASCAMPFGQPKDFVPPLLPQGIESEHASIVRQAAGRCIGGDSVDGQAPERPEPSTPSPDVLEEGR